MNVALIFAGGIGQRMHTGGMPKQFLKLHGKPILVYTIEHFQKCAEIDAIVLVSVKEWIEYCHNLVKEYSLSKVVDVVPGGITGFQSIDNGLMRIEELFPSDSITLIHDGVRPLINQSLITKCIRTTLESGSAVTVSPAKETILINDSEGRIETIIDRSKCQIAQAPQCFILSDISDAHRKAKNAGLSDFIDSVSLMKTYGYEIHTVEGPADNIKITTPADFFVFRAFVEARENSEIFGV